jgi:pimeloyl-ACP methyl ester carboxylesterase
MRPLARRLARAGYQTLNWYYPCLRHSIETHGRRLHELLDSLNAEQASQRLHLATYSMGSIVARVALERGRPSKLGRIVMLAPPLRGSHWATLVGPVSRCCVRTIDELAARPNSFVNSLAEPQGLEIGVIAARYDLLVHAGSSQLVAARDRIVLPGVHTFVPMQRDTAEQVKHFLAHGSFWRGEHSRSATLAKAEAKQP